MSTAVGGQAGSRAVSVLPPISLELFTVGIALAGNFLFLPSSKRPPERGLVLIGWPATTLRTALRAASARPVLEPTSARIEIAKATVPLWREIRSLMFASLGVRLVFAMKVVPSPRALADGGCDRSRRRRRPAKSGRESTVRRSPLARSRSPRRRRPRELRRERTVGGRKPAIAPARPPLRVFLRIHAPWRRREGSGRRTRRPAAGAPRAHRRSRAASRPAGLPGAERPWARSSVPGPSAGAKREGGGAAARRARVPVR